MNRSIINQHITSNKMGMYDFFKEKCPQCGKNIGYNENGDPIGEIQSTDFTGITTIENNDGMNCFRTFEVGTSCGCFPKDGCILLEHPCCHCKTRITAVFRNGVFNSFKIAMNNVAYARPSFNDFVACNFNNFLDMDELRQSFLRQYPPNQYDIDYFVGLCPHCNEEFKDIPTKYFLFMRNGQIFSRIHDIRVFFTGLRYGCFPMNASLFVKKCNHCDKSIYASFYDGELTHFHTS